MVAGAGQLIRFGLGKPEENSLNPAFKSVFSSFLEIDLTGV
jgi:hypothetical protein